MASVGGLSGGSSSIYGASVHGYTGLASGLDVDNMIMNMTQGTKTKIDNKYREKTALEWQQSAYRSISSKLIAFEAKYLNLTAKNSLRRVSTFDRSVITSLGGNASKVSVNGASDMLDTMQITRVEQLATTASKTGDAISGVNIFSTGNLDTGSTQESKLAGATLSFEYGNGTYSVVLPTGSEYDYSSIEDTVVDGVTKKGVTSAINDALANVSTSSTTKLSDSVQVSYTGGKFVFKNVDGAGNHVAFTKVSTAAAKEALGITDDMLHSGNMPSGGSVTGNAVTDSDLMATKTFADRVADKRMYFSYNGITKSIKMPSWQDLTNGIPDGSGGTITDPVEIIQKTLQDGLDDAFGRNNIKVDIKNFTDSSGSGKGLSFSTLPADGTDILKVEDAEGALLGADGALKLERYASNRLSMNGKLSDKLMAGVTGATADDYKIKINGKEIQLSGDMTITEMMDKINSDPDLGVTVKYLETANRFVISANSSGSNGTITYSGKVLDEMFGTNTSTTEQTIEGKNAEFYVRYGESEEVKISRSSNTFSMDGASFTLNGTFDARQFDASGNPVLDASGQPVLNTDQVVSFKSEPNVDAISEQVKSMVDDYNELLKEVFDQTTKRPNRSYKPLTDEEKEDYSEKQIEKYEEKAKEGILFNDSILSGLSSSLRTLFSGVTDIGTLKEMGLTVSSDYSEHGKITFEEETFKEALKKDPEKIQKLFTGDAAEDKEGFMSKMETVFEKYAKYNGQKGSLITKAGTSAQSSTLLTNTITKQIDKIDDEIEDLADRLQDEMDRYNSQFTYLEQLIAQMNSQSGMLSGLGG